MCGILVTRTDYLNNYVVGLIIFIIKWRCEQWWYASHSAVRFDNIRPIIKKIMGFFFQCRTLHHSNISFPGRINYNAQIHTGKLPISVFTLFQNSYCLQPTTNTILILKKEYQRIIKPVKYISGCCPQKYLFLLKFIYIWLQINRFRETTQLWRTFTTS